ncbi:MAG: hypothetical protein ACKOE5_10825, partial [Cytophagales bacterium]
MRQGCITTFHAKVGGTIANVLVIVRIRSTAVLVVGLIGNFGIGSINMVGTVAVIIGVISSPSSLK